MNKEQQDKLWNELSEESQRKIQHTYLENIQEAHNSKNSDEMVNVLLGKNEMLIDLFGSHNLNPKPTPKTWEDVEKAEGGDIRVDSKVINPNGRAWGLGLKYHQKAESTLKLAILIDLGYGGMVSEEEKSAEYDESYFSIIPNDKNEIIICRRTSPFGGNFITFHSRQQAEEFMSYESNRKLVEQYYMM